MDSSRVQSWWRKYYHERGVAVKWHIVSDSSCDMLEGYLAPDIYLSIVPQKVIIDQCEYEDDANIDIPSMMAAMKAARKTGSSSPAPQEFAIKFAQGDHVICVCLSSALSATFQAACLARDEIHQANPDRLIFVLDSKRTSGAMELIIMRLKEMIEQGLSFAEITESITDFSSKTQVLFTLECFDNFIKGGRMSRSSAILASVLSIRPIAMGTPEGTIRVIDKPRGLPMTIRRMVEHMQKLKDLHLCCVIISHCNNLDVAQRIQTLLQQVAAPKEILIRQLRGICSYYADQQGVAVSF